MARPSKSEIAAGLKAAKLDWIVGRGAEIAQLVELAQSPSVISVVGPPGIGKTTLARAVSVFVQNPYFVTASQTQDALEYSVASQLDIQMGDAQSDTFETICTLFKDGGVLILDDAEGRIDVVAAFVRRLRDESNAVIITTTQIPLGVPRENVIRLEGLDNSFGALLFHKHCRQMGADTSDMATSVVDVIIEEMEGNPLMIELATHRTTLFSPQEIQKRWSDPGFLTGPNEGRFSSLDEAIQHSLELLSEDAKACVVSLTVLDSPLPVDEVVQFLDRLVGQGMSHLTILVERRLLRRTDKQIEVLPVVKRYIHGRFKLEDEPMNVAAAIEDRVSPLLDSAAMGDPEAVDVVGAWASGIKNLFMQLDQSASETLVIAYLVSVRVSGQLHEATIQNVYENFSAFSDRVKLEASRTYEWFGFEAMAQQCRDAITKEPFLTDAKIETARFYMATRQFDALDELLAQLEPESIIGQGRVAYIRATYDLLARRENNLSAAFLAEKALREQNDLFWLARAKLVQGQVFSYRLKFNQALENFEMGRSLCETSRIFPLGRFSTLQIAHCYTEMGQHEKAMETLRNDLDAIRRWARSTLRFDHAFAQSFQLIGRFAEAIQLYESATVNPVPASDLEAALEHFRFTYVCCQLCVTGVLEDATFSKPVLNQRYEALAAASGKLTLEPQHPFYDLVRLVASEETPIEKLQALRKTLLDIEPDRRFGAGPLVQALFWGLGARFGKLALVEFTFVQNGFRNRDIFVDPPVGIHVGSWNLFDSETTVTRVLRALLSDPNGLTDDQLAQHVWPGETILESALTNRIKVNISAVRKLGVNVKREDGRYIVDGRFVVFGGGSWELFPAGDVT